MLSSNLVGRSLPLRKLSTALPTGAAEVAATAKVRSSRRKVTSLTTHVLGSNRESSAPVRSCRTGPELRLVQDERWGIADFAPCTARRTRNITQSARTGDFFAKSGDCASHRFPRERLKREEIPLSRGHSAFSRRSETTPATRSCSTTTSRSSRKTEDSERRGRDRSDADGKASSAAVAIPADRKETFKKARRVGVTRRAVEGGGVPRDKIGEAIVIDGVREPKWDQPDGKNGDGSVEDFGRDDPSTLPESIEDVACDGKVYTSGKADATRVRRKGGGAKHRKRKGGGKPKPQLADDADSRPDEGTSGTSTEGEAGSDNSKSREQQQEEEGEQQQQQQEEEEELHPVLGRLVADLKYKRVYVTSAQALLNAPVWQKEKTLQPVKCMEIAEAKYSKKQVVDGMPGVITLYKRPLLPIVKEKQAYTLGIVDGQHRLGALLMLAEKGYWDAQERNLIVEVFDTATDHEIEHLFTEINRSEPMPAIDDSRVTAEQKKEDVAKAVLQLHELFPDSFGGSRVRPPSINAELFVENVINSGLMERHDLHSAELLVDYLLRINEIISKRDPKRWALMVGKGEGQYPTKKALANALRKAKATKFYLGLDFSWMHA